MAEGNVVVTAKHEVVVVVVRDRLIGGQGLDSHFYPLNFGQHRPQMADHHAEISF